MKHSKIFRLTMCLMVFSNLIFVQPALGAFEDKTQTQTSDSTYTAVTSQIESKAEEQDWGLQAKKALAGIAEASTNFPVIGSWISTMMKDMNPDDKWMVGLGLLIAVGLLIRRLLR